MAAIGPEKGVQRMLEQKFSKLSEGLKKCFSLDFFSPILIPDHLQRIYSFLLYHRHYSSKKKKQKQNSSDEPVLCLQIKDNSADNQF